VPEKRPRQCRSIRFNIDTDLDMIRAARDQGKSIQRFVHDAVELYILLTGKTER
jgi:hypothetical protein